MDDRQDWSGSVESGSSPIGMMDQTGPDKNEINPSIPHIIPMIVIPNPRSFLPASPPISHPFQIVFKEKGHLCLLKTVNPNCWFGKLLWKTQSVVLIITLCFPVFVLTFSWTSQSSMKWIMEWWAVVFAPGDHWIISQDQSVISISQWSSQSCQIKTGKWKMYSIMIIIGNYFWIPGEFCESLEKKSETIIRKRLFLWIGRISF